MNTEIPTTDILDEELKPALPTGLKVLTLLTFIGCGVSALLTLLMPKLYDLILSFLEKAKDSGKDFSNKEIADMDKAKTVIELARQNTIPLMVIGLIGIALWCFVDEETEKRRVLAVCSRRNITFNCKCNYFGLFSI